MTGINYAERVAAGMAWLDENRPGWEPDINLNKLQLWHCTKCIMGQLFGNFSDSPFCSLVGDRASPETIAKAARHGFMMDIGEESDETYDELTAEWVRQIKARRELEAST